MKMNVNLISGGLHLDQRGIVSFVNDFDFKGVDRFYTVRGHAVGEPRGWTGNRKEHKRFTALSGTLLVAVVAPNHWEFPESNLLVGRYALSVLKPAVLHVPSGQATASVMLSPDAHLGVFFIGEDRRRPERTVGGLMWGHGTRLETTYESFFLTQWFQRNHFSKAFLFPNCLKDKGMTWRY